MSPSLRGLQILLSRTAQFCHDWDICLNPKKSKTMYFGKRQNNLCRLKLNGSELEWIEKWPYLGIVLMSGPKFGCCIAEKIRKFYRATNNILRIEGRSNDLLILQLIESHCIPVLTYGIETIVVANQDIRRQMRVAYNSVFRRIFNYRPWQSVRELQACLSRPTWEDLLAKRTEKFLKRIRSDTFLAGLFSP